MKLRETHNTQHSHTHTHTKCNSISFFFNYFFEIKQNFE